MDTNRISNPFSIEEFSIELMSHGGGEDGGGSSGGGGGIDVKKNKGGGTGTGTRCCQVEKCTSDLAEAKQYHRRHKVCEFHAKAQVVVVAGVHQRFCQQCSRFHELLEFDESKRSCRRRLAGHNERRRKNNSLEFKRELVCVNQRQNPT